MKVIKLSKDLSISAIDYANQGNSIIGIRGSGKTYSATKIAEELILAGIPIVAFDPTGIWQNLRFGVNGNKGLPVVVAGGLNADIPLDETNATEIVGAALQEGISLVIDLQGVSTSNKSKWLRIVSDCIEYLMSNNQQFGLRHIFIEEAAEFVPQRPQPSGALAYSRIESMARIGRNYGLGYTLINQRAEEIAKAVFEISELVLVHRQGGKNSLNSIKDWLNVRGQKDVGIVNTLSSLANGECWAIDNNIEQRISILPKKTFHPDPKSGNITSPKETRTDVSVFIKNIISILDSPSPDEQLAKPGNKPTASKLEVENKRLTFELEGAEFQIKELKTLVDSLYGKLEQINKIASNQSITPDTTPTEHPIIRKQIIHNEDSPSPIKSKPTLTGSGAMRMLKAAAMFHPEPISKQRMATIAGISIKSSTLRSYMASIKRDELITLTGDKIALTAKGILQVGEVERVPIEPKALIEMWCNILGSENGASRMLRYLGGQYPLVCSKAAVGDNTNISPASSTFRSYVAVLKRNGLISVNGNNIKAADEFFN